MSSSSNPIEWTWPLPGEDVPPYSVESGFGPVSKNDSIILTFTPASYSGLLILYCGWQDGDQGIVWTIYNNKGSPFTYHFNETTPNGNDTRDRHLCHFLQPTNSGNTQTFQYLNTPARDSIVWQQSGPSAIVSSPTSTSSSSSSSSSSSTNTGQSTSTPTDLPAAAVPSSSSHGLSVGAAVGITIGVIAVLLGLGALAFFARRRMRRRRREAGGAQPMADNPANKMEPGNGPEGFYDGKDAGPMQQPSTRKVGELDGQARSEMDAARQARSEMDAMRTGQPHQPHASELAGEERAELPGE